MNNIKKHDFLNVLLVMYSKNKLTVVDFLSSQNLVLHDITDISNGKENGKPKRSSKFRRIIHNLGKKNFEKWRIYFVVFLLLRFCRGTERLYYVCGFVRPSIYLFACPSGRCMLLVKWKVTSNCHLIW